MTPVDMGSLYDLAAVDAAGMLAALLYLKRGTWPERDDSETTQRSGGNHPYRAQHKRNSHAADGRRVGA